jgi:hypothetical protein
MRTLILLTLSVAAIANLATEVSAQGIYVGRGGPPAYYEPGPYGPGYHPPPRPYYRDDPRPYFGTGGRPLRGSPCAYGWTVQDGVCKPYRGY